MRIPSTEIPQADVLDEVIRTVEAVSYGAKTYDDIAKYLGKVARQGRYYRRASEILGFVQNIPSHNSATLTPLGQRFIDKPGEREALLVDAVLKSSLFQRVIPYLESTADKGVSKSQLEFFISTITQPVGESMIPRRVSTVIGWLTRVGLLTESRGRFFLSKALPEGLNIVVYESSEEPLSPKQYDLNEYKNVAEKVKSAQGYISAQIDAARVERAGSAHQKLLNLVADRVRRTGAIPKQNKYVDLSAVVANSSYMFEMKSTTEENTHSQVRHAIAQLYEYRYIQQVPDAKLVVVIENPFPKDKAWLIDYIVSDRSILVAWDGDGKHLYCPDKIKTELGFLLSS